MKAWFVLTNLFLLHLDSLPAWFPPIHQNQEPFSIPFLIPPPFPLSLSSSSSQLTCLMYFYVQWICSYFFCDAKHFRRSLIGQRNPYGEGTIIISILHLGKLRLREVKKLVHGHTASSIRLIPKPICLNITLYCLLTNQPLDKPYGFSLFSSCWIYFLSLPDGHDLLC